MSVRVLHLIDTSLRWHQLDTLRFLIQLLPHEQYHQELGILEPNVNRWLAQTMLPLAKLRPSIFPCNHQQRVRGYCQNNRIDLLHIWTNRYPLFLNGLSVPALISCSLAESRPPLQQGPTGESDVCWVCESETAANSLPRAGTEQPRRTTVIPYCLNSPPLRLTEIANQLSLPKKRVVVLLPELLGHTSDERYCEMSCAGIWAGLMLWHINESVRVIVPGDGGSLPILRRLVDGSNAGDIVHLTQQDYFFGDLLALADFLIWNGDDEVDRTTLSVAARHQTRILVPEGALSQNDLLQYPHSHTFERHAEWRRQATFIGTLLNKLQQTGPIPVSALPVSSHGTREEMAAAFAKAYARLAAQQ